MNYMENFLKRKVIYKGGLDKDHKVLFSYINAKTNNFGFEIPM